MSLAIDWQTLSQQLAITFAHFMWQAVVVGVVLAVSLRLTVRRDAKTRYALACLAYVALPICVAATFSALSDVGRSMAVQNEQAPGRATVNATAPAPTVDATNGLVQESSEGGLVDSVISASLEPATHATMKASEESAAWSERFQVGSPYLLALYTLGVVALLARNALATWSGRKLRLTAQPVADSRILALIAEQSERMGLGPAPLVALCNRVSVPVVVGMLKPTILLPPALLCGLDASQVAAILRHEMAHIRRYDPLVHLLQRIVESLLFFHPVTWWISRRISAERENCCDDLASVECGSLQYAGALLRMAELCAAARGMQITPQLTAIAADGGNASQLSCRIHRLLGEPVATRLAVTPTSWSIALGAVLLCSLTAFAVTQNSDDAPQQAENQGEVPSEAVTESNPRLPEIDAKNKPESDNLEASNRSYAALPIRWGEAVSGLRIGVVFLNTPDTGTESFRHGDLAQAQLFVQNVSNQSVECQFMVPHPMDGWGLNIDDADGNSVRHHQVYISSFSPLRLFSAALLANEIQPISGKLPKFREGNEDEGYVPELKHVEFRIADEVPEQAEYSPPFTYGMPGGRYHARCFANLRRADIPDANLSVETGTVTFEVGDGARDTDTKYPYCVVDVENLETRTLADAIAAFNEQSMESPVGRFQPPVTETEAIAAIKSFSGQSHLPASVKSTLLQIVSSKELPATAYFRRFTRFDDGQLMHRVWWVRLVITGDDPPVYSVPVRAKLISSRSFTQKERQQHASGGLTLINRFSSYFEVPPNILLLAEFPQDAKNRLIADAKAAIAGDADALLRMFHWEGASDSTRQFVATELQQLRKADIVSIEIRPRNFKAKMVHWSAYQRYQPNLPIVGYLDIEYKSATGESGPAKTLSLEMGKFGEELRLVNYIEQGARELPPTLGKGLSVSGQTEPLADGTYLMTTITTNPGTLLSAHLGNEEIWQREF